MHFAEHPPSSSWERVPLGGRPEQYLWAWYHPAGAPPCVIARLPDEAHRDAEWRRQITLRRVCQAVGIDPRLVTAWYLDGIPQETRPEAHAAFDGPLPEPGPAGEPTITLLAGPLAPQGALSAASPAPGLAADALDRMDAEWKASLLLEVQAGAVATQLNAILARINSLNRDLPFEEAQRADQQDKREWHEARRWLRDVAARLSRALKDHHVGITSSAGKRNVYASIYEQYVAPRRSFSGIEQMEREFEMYRKTLQTLLNNMNAVLGTAAQDGERRAQQVLSRIASKVRAGRAKRG